MLWSDDEVENVNVKIRYASFLQFSTSDIIVMLQMCLTPYTLLHKMYSFYRVLLRENGIAMASCVFVSPFVCLWGWGIVVT